MAITDAIVAVILIYSSWDGWRRGFLRTLLGPVSLLLATIVSYFYYNFTHDFLKSLLIGLIGPFVLNIILAVVLTLWNKTVNQNQKANNFSRAWGGLFNLVWMGGIILLTLVLLVFMPPNTFGIEDRKSVV